jgi:hypothetical protein
MCWNILESETLVHGQQETMVHKVVQHDHSERLQIR